MIRCVRIWTGEDGNSLFEEGAIDLPKGERGDVLSGQCRSRQHLVPRDRARAAPSPGTMRRPGNS